MKTIKTYESFNHRRYGNPCHGCAGLHEHGGLIAL